MSGLSQDAMAVLGAYFSMGTPGKTELTFHMVESRPTERAQAALNELVQAKVLSEEPFNRLGGVTYRLIGAIDRRAAMKAAMSSRGFNLTEPTASPIGEA